MVEQAIQGVLGHPENKTKLTSRGQKVRSISELLIAEALYKYSIPFHYEEELEVEGKTFAPILLLRGGIIRSFIWITLG